MIEKFIEGTNEQYSIREDGTVIRNYLFAVSKGKKTEEKIFSKKIMKVGKQSSRYLAVRISVNKKSVAIILKNALYEHFIGEITNGYKVVYDKSNLFPINLKDLQLIKQDSNSDSKKKERFKKYQQAVTKSYAALMLNMKTKELSDDLYEHFKNTLLFKRKISREHNINIRNVR